MKIKELKKWFIEIPEEFDDLDIEAIDIDHTRDTEILNLVEKNGNKAVIKSLYRKPKYIKKENV